MRHDDDPEVLDLGLVDEEPPAGADPEPSASRGLPRRGLFALGGLAVAGAAVAAIRSATSAPPPAPRQALPTPSAGSPSTAAPTADAVDAAPLVVTELGAPLLGGPRLDVFGLGGTAVVRVELATGRVTRTTLPPLADAGLSLVPVRHGVIVHLDDWSPGYLVPDGRLPVELPRTLDGPGPMLPGPDLDHVWVQLDDRDGTGMALMTVDGRRTGTTVAMTTYATAPPQPDGTGYPLFGAVGGYYRGLPAGTRRLTAGVVTASGPPGWLAVECDDRDVCAAVLIRPDGNRRTVPGLIDPRWPIGQLAPDGERAALYTDDTTGTGALALVDLRTGGRRRVDLGPLDGANPGQDASSLAWSPDSRWLFAVDASARIVAVDAVTARATPLVPGSVIPALPVVLQIAARSGAPR